MGSDGITLRGTFAGSRLKLFFKRERYLYSPDDIDSGLNNETYQEIYQEITQGYTSRDFEIYLPTLIIEQRSQYAQFDDNSEGISENN